MLKTQVIGNLGKDATVNTVGGKSVINFSVAHTEKYKDGQGTNQTKTTWVDCSYWVDKTGIAQYLTKGTQVHVDGQPEVRTFQKQDGTFGASFSLRVREIQLLGSPRNENSQPAAEKPAQTANASEVSDDLPF